MSSFPNFTIKQMLECGVHFGHKSMLWNPKMAPYIYCERNGVHIINLQKTAQLMHDALYLVYQTIKANPRAKILFVGTKYQASPFIKKYAMHCGQFFVNHRWLGGMLTNWDTVSKSIKKLSEYEKILLEEITNSEGKYNKKELLEIDRSREKLDKSLGGIRDMRQKPDLIFIIDTNKEKNAVKEAKKLGIPVMAILDTNSKVEDIDYPIAGNDDSSKSIELYCDLLSQAVLAGLEGSLVDSGIDPSEAKERVRDAIDKDNKKSEERKISFDKVQERKVIIEKEEKTKLPKKRVIEVGDFIPTKNDKIFEEIKKATAKTEEKKDPVKKSMTKAKTEEKKDPAKKGITKAKTEKKVVSKKSDK